MHKEKKRAQYRKPKAEYDDGYWYKTAKCSQCGGIDEQIVSFLSALSFREWLVLILLSGFVAAGLLLFL